MRRGPAVVTRSTGYRMLWMPEHPDAHDGRVYEHRIVAERMLGRPLTRGWNGEHVHHINGDPSDNRPENLMVMSARDHVRVHLRRTHCIHGHEFTAENTYIRPDNGKRMCRTCNLARKRAAYHARKRAGVST